jgi:hypothetical protein
MKPEEIEELIKQYIKEKLDIFVTREGYNENHPGFHCI